jgi:pullulanase
VAPIILVIKSENVARPGWPARDEERKNDWRKCWKQEKVVRGLLKANLNKLKTFLPALLAAVCYSTMPLSAEPPETAQFQSFLYSKNDLGATYSPNATTLKLWAPRASAVNVILFDGPVTPPVSSFSMSSSPDGIWSLTINGNLDGKYYQYEITPSSADGLADPCRVNDPYARGCSANSGRTLIFDPVKTSPSGWDQDHFVTLMNNVDAVIYEVHVRDFTINTNSGVSPNNRGKYLGMVQPGTKSPDGLATGLDHLKELGITHVELLPVFDFASGDEREKADEYTWYNWGYAPVLYYTPAGSYASDPDGTARQKELKELVQAFHRNHIGVIMDVVFNHTAATGMNPASVFDKVFPGYYYRLDGSGHYANATYCGNELASEKPMVRKFIVDCVKYWMTEYHVDGFRFDLMGILDRETMAEVYREVKQINPSVIIFGEGWDMEHTLPADQMMTQANVFGTGIAAFNDGIRDNIRGDSDGGGFVQGDGAPVDGLERFELNIKGQSTGKNSEGSPVFSPNETINYDSCHDDLCLWDKLVLSTPDAPETLRENMDKLAAGILLTSQGVPFIHGGDEFLRSKNFNSNSYNDNDPRVNPINWSLKAKHTDVFNFYRGMIALRKNHPAFRMSDKGTVDKSLDFLHNVPFNVVAYVLKDHANGDSWKNILVVYNGSLQTQELDISGHWTIVANDKLAGTNALETTDNKIIVAPCSLIIAYTDDNYPANVLAEHESVLKNNVAVRSEDFWCFWRGFGEGACLKTL